MDVSRALAMLGWRVRFNEVWKDDKKTPTATDAYYKLQTFASLNGDEMYRVRKASGECLVDVSRALAMLGWRVHFNEVWKDDKNTPTATDAYYKLRTKGQIAALSKTLAECHEIRRRVLCGIAHNSLDH